MFFYQLLTNVEYTPNVLECSRRFLTSSRNPDQYGWLLSSTKLKTISISKHWSGMHPVKCCIDRRHSQLFRILEDLIHVSMVGVFHVSRRVLFTLDLGLILVPRFPGGLENLLLSTHLRIFDFRF